MDRELAKHAASVALKSMGDLGDLLELIKNHCDAREYDAYARAIAAVSGGIATQIMHRAWRDMPVWRMKSKAKLKNTAS